jgi:hypothetical protein
LHGAIEVANWGEERDLHFPFGRAHGDDLGIRKKRGIFGKLGPVGQVQVPK